MSGCRQNNPSVIDNFGFQVVGAKAPDYVYSGWAAWQDEKPRMEKVKERYLLFIYYYWVVVELPVTLYLPAFTSFSCMEGLGAHSVNYRTMPPVHSTDQIHIFKVPESAGSQIGRKPR